MFVLSLDRPGDGLATVPESVSREWRQARRLWLIADRLGSCDAGLVVPMDTIETIGPTKPIRRLA